MSSWASHWVTSGPPPEYNLDEPHPALDQPAGEQESRPKVGGLLPVQPVFVAGLLGFLRQVDGLGGVLLHLERQLVGRDPGGEVGVGRVEALLIHLADQVVRPLLCSAPTVAGGLRLRIGDGPLRKSVP